jgi:hypothetical protein
MIIMIIIIIIITAATIISHKLYKSSRFVPSSWVLGNFFLVAQFFFCHIVFVFVLFGCYLCCSMYCLCKCVLPPGDNPIAVNKHNSFIQYSVCSPANLRMRVSFILNKSCVHTGLESTVMLFTFLCVGFFLIFLFCNHITSRNVS